VPAAVSGDASTPVPTPWQGGFPHVTVSVVALDAAGHVAPAGSVPSPTVSVMVTLCGAAGQVKFAVAELGVSIEPAVADQANVIAEAFGATAPAASATTPDVTAADGLALAEVHVAQFTGVPFTRTPPELAPPSVPVAEHVRKTLTSVVVCAATENAAEVPSQLTFPSGEVDESEMV
jgi:hypothetical protein